MRESLFVQGRGFPHTRGRRFVLSEYGGYNLLVSDHVWQFDKVFGYRHFTSRTRLLDAYRSLVEQQLKLLIDKGLSTAVYTQTTDVEQETNGIITYDREVVKFNDEALRHINEDIWRRSIIHR